MASRCRDSAMKLHAVQRLRVPSTGDTRCRKRPESSTIIAPGGIRKDAEASPSSGGLGAPSRLIGTASAGSQRWS